jgi:hypothetical protein
MSAPHGIDARDQDLDRDKAHLDSEGDLWFWLADRERWAYLTDQGHIAEDGLQPYNTAAMFFPLNESTSRVLRRALHF